MTKFIYFLLVLLLLLLCLHLLCFLYQFFRDDLQGRLDVVLLGLLAFDQILKQRFHELMSLAVAILLDGKSDQAGF